MDITRSIIATVILALGFGCYAPSPKKGPKKDDCLSNETVWLCRGALVCACTKNTTPMAPLTFCARYGTPPEPLDAEADKIATAAYGPHATVTEQLFVACDDLHTKILPDDAKSLDVPVSFEEPPKEGQAWGDVACSQCIGAKCHAEAVNCVNDALCYCLDRCQVDNPDLTGQITAAECGCEPGDATAYNALVTCVQQPDGCVDACWPTTAPVCSCP